MRYLYQKEMNQYFSAPFGFVFAGIFLLLSGVMFTVYNLVGGNGDMAGTFELLKNVSSMIFPILTMRSFAEERRVGTEQMLLNSRLNCTQIVLAKYFSALSVFLVSLAVTLVYVFIISIYGTANYGAIAASYLGFILLSAAMISLCLLMASFAENQITSAVLSFGVIFALVLFSSLSKAFNIPVLTPILSALALTSRYDDFTLGILSLGPVVYYLSFTAVCLYLTVKNMERRRFI